MKHTVTLVNPPLSLEDRYGKDMKQFGAVSEPLGIAYIAGYLDSQNIPVRIIDAPALNLTIDDVTKEIVHGRYTIIGISMLTPAFGIVKELCRRLKIVYPEGVIVLGGAHCTVLPERTLKEINDAQIVCIGEGELTMAEIAKADDFATLDQIMGICYRLNNKVIRTETRPYIKDLDIIPPPARYLLPMEKYLLTDAYA